MVDILRVAFVGAGNVNFGRWNVPWNHSSRLENVGGIDVIAIADPDVKKAEEVLAAKRSQISTAHFYKNCKVFSDPNSVLPLKPEVVFIGIPPFCRGSFEKGKDIELMFATAGVQIFTEKPLSVLPPKEFLPYHEAVVKACRERNVIMSVGYMFR